MQGRMNGQEKPASALEKGQMKRLTSTSSLAMGKNRFTIYFTTALKFTVFLMLRDSLLLSIWLLKEFTLKEYSHSYRLNHTSFEFRSNFVILFGYRSNGGRGQFAWSQKLNRILHESSCAFCAHFFSPSLSFIILPSYLVGHAVVN